ncbi:unnamed protein product [Ixodes persulcatus]
MSAASVVARDTAAGPAEARPDGHRNTQPSIPEDKSNLSAKLHSARCDVIFLQTQHRLTLKGLHAEIAKLQQTVKGMQFALFNNGITLVDEDSYKARIEELEENLDKWCCHCRYLTSQLEHANKALVALNQRIQVQDWQHQAELKEKNSVIANLQRELEWKCRTLAEMEMSSRRRSFVRQLPGGEASAAETLTPQRIALAGRTTSRSPVPGSSQRCTHTLSPAKSELVHMALCHSPNRLYRRLPTLPLDRFHEDMSQSSHTCTAAKNEAVQSKTDPRPASAKCLPGIPLPLSSSRAGTDRLRGELRLPPLIDTARALSFPARSLVRQQLRVHCDRRISADEDLAIDQVPSPELKPKKITNRAVEVTTK